MAKLCVFGRIKTFTESMIPRWQKKFEVIEANHYDKDIADTCDIIWCEFLGDDLEKASLNKKPHQKLLCRFWRIEYWQGHFKKDRFNIQWDKVDHIFNTSPQYIDWINAYYPHAKVKYLRGGVDVDKFTLANRNIHEKVQVATVAKKFDPRKNPILAMMCAGELQRYKKDKVVLHYGGNGGDWLQIEEMKYLSGRMGLEQYIEGYQQDVNAFLENKDIYIHTAFDESFCFAIGEAMAKGIKTLTYNWPGADRIWPEYVVWNTPLEMCEKALDSPYEPEKYRQFIIDNYSLDLLMKDLEQYYE